MWGGQLESRRARLTIGEVPVDGGAGNLQHLRDVGGGDALLFELAGFGGIGVVDLARATVPAVPAHRINRNGCGLSGAGQRQIPYASGRIIELAKNKDSRRSHRPQIDAFGRCLGYARCDSIVADLV